MNIEQLPPIMTDEQVHELTGVPKGTLRYFRHRGHGGPKSFALTPRAIRYRREDVLAWIEEAYAKEERGDAA